jgi:prephenate dehydrogenase
MDMFSIGSLQFKERVNIAFARAIKHKNSNYFFQEQLRTKPIATGVFNVVQKVLLSNPDMLRDLLEEKTFEEFDEEK